MAITDIKAGFGIPLDALDDDPEMAKRRDESIPRLVGVTMGLIRKAIPEPRHIFVRVQTSAWGRFLHISARGPAANPPVDLWE